MRLVSRLELAEIRVVMEVLCRGIVVTATGFVIAPPNCFVYRFVVVIYIQDKGMFCSAVRASVSGRDAGVFLKVIFVIHVLNLF